MVAVVQLVEHQVVILGVAGSSPVSHPKCPSLVLGPFQFSACMLASSSSERAGLSDKMCVCYRRVAGLDVAFLDAD